MARLCRDCAHFLPESKKVSDVVFGLCCLYPKRLKVEANRWWCGHIKKKVAPKKKTAEQAAEDNNVALIIKYYCEYFKNKWGTNPTVTKKDAGAAKTLLKDRDMQEVEWIIAEYLEAPPQWYKDKGLKGLSHILSAVTQGQIIDRERGREPLEDFFRAQEMSCRDEDEWHRYRAFVKEKGERISFVNWREDWCK